MRKSVSEFLDANDQGHRDGLSNFYLSYAEVNYILRLAKSQDHIV